MVTANSRIRVMVVDDEARARRSLVSLLGTFPHLEVVAEASDGDLALALLLTAMPDVVVLDGIMPRMDGLHTAREIKRRSPQVGVILLTLYGDLEWDASRTGADAFLLKSAEAEEIADTITRVGSAAGGRQDDAHRVSA